MNGVLVLLCAFAVLVALRGSSCGTRGNGVRSIGGVLLGLLVVFCLFGAAFVTTHRSVQIAVDRHSRHRGASVTITTRDQQGHPTQSIVVHGDRGESQSPNDVPPLQTEPISSAEAAPADQPATVPAEDRPAEEETGTGIGEPTELPAGAPAEDPRASTDRTDELPATVIEFDKRPEWVEIEEKDEGDTHMVAVSSDVQLRLRDARHALVTNLKQATDQYIDRMLEHRGAARWVGIDATTIQNRYVKPNNIFYEKVDSSVGTAYVAHAKLELDREFHDQIEADWHDVMARAQLIRVGLVAFAVLGTLVLLRGYFRVDSATKGFYSGRLRFATAVAILVLVTAGWVLARSIPWVQL